MTEEIKGEQLPVLYDIQEVQQTIEIIREIGSGSYG